MKRILLFSILVVSIVFQVNAQQKPLGDERLDWWYEAKFGMFIHWGVYSLYGGVYKGYNQAFGDAAWILNRCKIPVAEYR
jgi:alpha-L-fucosidase